VLEIWESWRGASPWLRWAAGISAFFAFVSLFLVFSNVASKDAIPHVVLATTVLCASVGAKFASKRAQSRLISAPIAACWKGLQAYLVLFCLASIASFLMAIPSIARVITVPLADILRATSYLPLLLALASMTRGAPIKGRVRLMLDGAISASSIAVLSWYFVVAPVWAEATSSQFLSGWAAVHPVGDILVALFAAMAFTTASPVKEWRIGVIALAIGALLVAFAGNMSTLSVMTITGQSGIAYSAIWPLGFLFIAAASLSHFTKDVQESDLTSAFRAHSNPIRYILSLLGPYLIAMTSFGCVANAELTAKGNISPGTFFLGAALMMLVAVRQVMTQVENQGLGNQMLGLTQDLEMKVEKRTAQLQSLYSLSKSVGNSLDVEGVIKSSTQHALEALHGEALVINLTPFAFSGFARLTEFVRQIGLDDDEWVLDRLNILDSIWAGTTGVVHDDDFRKHMKYAMAPIVCKGKTLGWLCILRADQAFDRTEVSLLEGVASEIGTALENARLYEVARQMADIDSVTGLLNHRATQERFEFMFKASEDMEEPMSLIMIDVNNFKYFNDTYGHLAGDQVLKSIARLLRDVARPHDIAARYGGDEFILLLPNTCRTVAQRIVEEIHSRVANEGYPEPGSDRVIPFALSIGIASYPDEAKNRNELLYHADHDMFNQKRANSAAPVAPRRAIRKPTSGNGDSFDLLDSMISAVDNKDYYTRAHSEEVTEYALWIAQELGLSEEAQKTIRYAGLLHDVGKIGIPDEILRKPGHLTDEEYEVMKQHPVVGAMIVSSIPDMTDILPGVKHHHERWDGKGYPDALAGESIPLLARILAVPDTFSAMTTDRPYRKGMKWSEAMRKIREGRGTQFDPEIVDAFFAALDKRQEPLEVAA